MTAAAAASKGAIRAHHSHSETQVFIIAVEKPLLKERIELATLLWTSEIRAEYMLEGEADGSLLSLEEVADHCRSSGIPLVVMLKERLLEKERSVRVRHVLTRQEATLPWKDLVAYLRHHIGNDSTRTRPRVRQSILFRFHRFVPPFTINFLCRNQMFLHMRRKSLHQLQELGSLSTSRHALSFL